MGSVQNLSIIRVLLTRAHAGSYTENHAIFQEFYLEPNQMVLSRTQHKGLYQEPSVKGFTQSPPWDMLIQKERWFFFVQVDYIQSRFKDVNEWSILMYRRALAECCVGRTGRTGGTEPTDNCQGECQGALEERAGGRARAEWTHLPAGEELRVCFFF